MFGCIYDSSLIKLFGSPEGLVSEMEWTVSYSLFMGLKKFIAPMRP